MGDEHQRRPALPVQVEHQIDDLRAGRRVEIAGRLVGEQDRRLDHEGAGERHALLLAAGQFGGIVGGAVGKPDLRQLGPGAFEGVGAAGELERHGDVFQRRHVLDQVEGLEDDADVVAAKAGERVLVEAREIPAGDDDLAGARRLQAGHDHQKRRFARSRRPDDADRFPGRYIEANTLEHMDPGGAAAEAQMDVLETDGVMRHGTELLGGGGGRRRSPTYGAGPAKLKAGFARAVAIITTILALWTCPAWADKGPIRLVALGDSLSAGYMLAPEAAFPVKLEQALKARGYDVVVENAGVSGDTTSGGLERVDWSVPDGTDGVILELGANDALRGIDLDVTQDALRAIAEKLKARGIDVLVAGMLAPPNMGEAYAGRFNAIYPDLANQYGFVLYPFFLDGVAADPKLNLDDGMHPTPEGVDVIVERILPYVERLIARIENGSQASGG